MPGVGLVYDPIFLEHEAPGHPERPERLAACVEALTLAGLWDQLELLPGRPVSLEEAARVHDEAYLRWVFEEIAGKTGRADADTYYSPQTAEAARLAAGGTLALTLSVLGGEHRSGLALVRPPGHHAESDRAMGFCLLGNTAIAAAAAAAAGAKTAIVDFDVHHGNGTQHAFEDDPRVLFVSIHRGGHFYPGSGAPSETGHGAGRGTTLNLPLSPGAGNSEYLAAFDEQIGPALDAFCPDLLLVSVGYDAHRDDPLGGMLVDDDGFDAMALRLGQWSERLCRGRWVAVLEGGYDLRALSRGIVGLTRTLIARRQ